MKKIVVLAAVALGLTSPAFALPELFGIAAGWPFAGGQTTSPIIDNGFLLLVNGTSFLLLSDRASRLCLAGDC